MPAECHGLSILVCLDAVYLLHYHGEQLLVLDMQQQSH